MKYIVDRIEDNYAVCENEDKKIINIELEKLPFPIHEGSMIYEKNGKFFQDRKKEEERRIYLREKLNRIKNINKKEV